MNKPGGDFDSAQIESQISNLETQSYDPNFWNDRESAERTMQELQKIKSDYIPWKTIRQEVTESLEYATLAEDEGDSEYLDGLGKQLETFEQDFHLLETKTLLSGPNDTLGAYLEIHSGAGGTEACDWVQILMRMYLRWVEQQGNKAEIIDILEAEGGIKSVTLEITGDHIFGFLSGETGIHRLVRISPFDSGNRRHTTFASVYVSPMVDDSIEVDISPEDIRVDTYRASGAGGQHVNKTDSAVRMTHLKTNIVVQCQNERSQIKNRATAMKMLRSRLYEHYKEEQAKEQAKDQVEKKDIAWGHQIRSYVFHPYTMVKDHRTSTTIGNGQSVIDGNINPFIESYLHWKQEES